MSLLLLFSGGGSGGGGGSVLMTLVNFKVLKGNTPVPGVTIEARLEDQDSCTEDVLQSLEAVTDTTDSQGEASLDLVRSSEFVKGDGTYLVIIKEPDGSRRVKGIKVNTDLSEITWEDLLQLQ